MRLTLLTLGLGACDGGSRKSEVTTGSATLASAAASTILTASATASGPSAPVVSASAAASSEPPFPTEPSPRPTTADWKADDLNPLIVGQCSLTRIREWVRVTCPGAFWLPWSSWGTPAKDYMFEDGNQTLIVRVHPGMYALGADTTMGVHFSLVWPRKAARPTLLLESKSASATAPWPEPKPLPAVPTEDEPAPDEADWFVASPVNTASTHTGKRCSLAVSGQWARLTCKVPTLATWHDTSPFGIAGRDFVRQKRGIVGENGTTMDFRMRKGLTAESVLVSTAFESEEAFTVTLRYSWPADAAQPTVLTFAEATGIPDWAKSPY